LNLSGSARARAFTLVELLAVIGILGFLIALVVVVNNSLPARAESVACVTHLRSLHTSFAAYIQDKGHWPQEPEELGDREAPLEDWWLAEMAPYGAVPEVWMCPSIKRLITNKSKNGRPKIHYMPTMFDDQPMTPYKWSTQPWLIELGNMHGQGANICFPDGSIRTMDAVMGPG
jgi:prepilin-type N-terminal cleavage/methylation domain-containing protein/prepilin-type processing-associated H-X9-DG protein